MNGSELNSSMFLKLISRLFRSEAVCLVEPLHTTLYDIISSGMITAPYVFK